MVDKHSPHLQYHYNLQELPMGTDFTHRDSPPSRSCGVAKHAPIGTPLKHFHEIFLAAHNLGGIVDELVNL